MAGKRGAAVREILDSRRDVIELLAERPRQQAEIATALDISRSTVTRAMDQIQEYGLAVRSGNEYELTQLGDRLRQIHTRYRAEVSGLLEAESLIQHIPEEAPFHPSILEDATWHAVESGAPYQVRDRVTDAFQDAVAIREFGRTRSEQESATVHRTKILEEGRPVEAVLSRELFSHLREDELGQELLAADNFDVAVHEDVPYGLFILEQPGDTVVVMVIYDEENSMKGVIRNNAPKALAWAEWVYKSFRDEAVPVSEVIR